jgi:hypothetical protein
MLRAKHDPRGGMKCAEARRALRQRLGEFDPDQHFPGMERRVIDVLHRVEGQRQGERQHGALLPRGHLVS